MKQQTEHRKDYIVDAAESQGPQVEAAPVVLSQEEDDLALALALQALDASDDADAEIEHPLRLESARAAGMPESKIRVKVAQPGVVQPLLARGPALVYSERIYRLEGQISIRNNKGGKPKY